MRFTEEEVATILSRRKKQPTPENKSKTDRSKRIFQGKYIPTEDEECYVLVEWLELNKFLFSHLAQSTYTGFKTQKHNSKMGVRRGVPDYLIIIPYWYTKSHNNTLLFAEIKAKKKEWTHNSEEQIEWEKEINACNNVNTLAKLFYGADEAIDFIHSLKK